MAEVLFDDDDDDDFWIEDPYAEADDLAEHTMQSPVLINYDPTLDIEGDWEDWDDWSGVDGDFFDFEEPKRKRRKLDDTGNREDLSSIKHQKRELPSMKDLPELSLGEPMSSDEDKSLQHPSIVKWKVRGNSPKLPILEPGQEEKVCILKDWKERFKPPPSKHEDGTSRLNHATQRAVAVVIENRRNSAAAQNISKDHRDFDGPTPEPSTAPSHPSKAPNLQRINGIRGGITSTTKEPITKRKREASSSPEPAPEPVPSAVEIRTLPTGRAMRQSGGQKRKTRDNEEPEPGPKRTRSKPPDDAAAKKENVRPKDAAFSNKAAAKKENIRHNAVPVQRRSTRRK
ncbi:MAG: hypothetical protein Q9166_002266 [cf. Caloplaca sp. 2 TL-2023]